MAVSLVAAGALLAWLFRGHVEREFDSLLYGHLEDLTAASEIVPDGTLSLTWTPSDPRFGRPLSGWYWQIGDGADILFRSTSLWRARLTVSAPRVGAVPIFVDMAGPGGRAQRVLVAGITLPESETRYVFAVAGPRSYIDLAVRNFTTKLAWTLASLGVGMLIAIAVQVWFGLRPLQAMRRALSDIRAGRARHLPEGMAEEVRPLAHELNALLDHNAALLEWARSKAGNLAHALKNPLTVIRNEADGIEGERGEVLRHQAAVIAGQIDRYLRQTRAAGGCEVIGARARVDAVVDDLLFSVGRIYAERALDIRVDGLEGVEFRGDAEDLGEMLGNLLDNACKWARSSVRISGRLEGGELILSVVDDGPGIPEARRDAALGRGGRLDESVAGSGLGLDIAADLAMLYRGRLTLETAPGGGLEARLRLPAAA